MVRLGHTLKATLLRTVRKYGRKANRIVKWLMDEEMLLKYRTLRQDVEWLAVRRRFMWQRLWLTIGIAIFFVSTFIVQNIFQKVFNFQQATKLTPEVQNLFFTAEIFIFLSLVGCLILHQTRIARRYPEALFLCMSFSITLVEQIVATLKGFALPDRLAWIVVFLTQATLIPIRWYLHLVSQVVVLLYYFTVNTALGLKLPPPYTNHSIYDLTLILSIFWVCFISDLAVYLYERLQSSEFYARKELQTAYQKVGVAEAKYRSIFENAVEGIFQSTPDGRYITANPALASIYGYSSPEEVIELADIANQLYVDPSRYAEFVHLIEQDGRVSGFESQIYRRDGSIVWISQKAYAVRDGNNRLLYYEGLIEDITKRKQVETALQEQLNFLQVLTDTIPTPVFYQNPQGIYVGCNQAFEEALGLSKQQIIGKSVFDLVPKDLAERYYQADKVLFDEQGVQTYEGAVLYQDGKKHDVIFYKATFLKADGTLGGLVGVILDISDRKRTEEALRVFFHAVSHDLRNPVLGTLMVLKNLLNQSAENSSISVSRSILERMVQSSDRQLSLINSLMETHVNEIQGVVLQTEKVQLYSVVEAAIADLEPMLQENQVTLTNLVSPDLPTVNADPTQLWRVFSNLIVNAMKHNPPNLSITVNATVEGDKIRCTVADNGVGMSQQQSEQLFNLYFRGSSLRSSVSLGLGLYLCKQIINAHGGKIGVTSAPQAGATFWFTLPVTHQTIDNSTLPS
ncbi:PAS domain S-box protein [Aetokthonos hydrillicola Thurmond2011]|uniref:histidine kinase n=2 Tax=Aetokthonos TaxID=1550243 RepID=A0AAP5ID29_9CYAN|nr:PAS domain-containing sensor histidine kinase [Aetokthonos hydrillicola]MBO3459552.1 PAS domain S-box protein [Aetokthonos hydrillicola CCALA 1050]MBW4590302.1 PAS domain S-box protein [Aetokthonos hydrillicola CCALA 1050]MDR9899410.1 PAS domain S-box protein [Aetokthonos hydrillicola Thurmond2011]